MKKWVRWQGLIAFVVVTTSLAVLWLFFVDGFVRRMIEKVGTSLVGAEVDVNQANVKLIPLGITLNGLQVTNPQAPATNSLECTRIAFSLDSLNLLRRKVIVNEMAIEGVRFATPRKRPGAVPKPPEKAPAAESKSPFSLSFSMPDVKKILQTEQLESPKLIESAKADLQREKEAWQKRMNVMPDKAVLAAYKSRIEKLRQSKQSGVMGVVGQLEEIRALTKDIEGDLSRVKQARAAFSTDLSSAKLLLDRAERGPLDDVRRLRDKYSISTAGLQHMSQVLFGDTITSWVRTSLLWYNRLKPVIERAAAQKGDVKVVKPIRGRGVDVRFKEARPLPDFLISKAAVSAALTAGTLSGTIKNITPDQDVLGSPLTFAFSGENLKNAQRIDLAGALNHIIPSKPEDTVSFAMRGYRVKDIALSGNKDLPITLQEGRLDLDLRGVHEAKAIKAKFVAIVKSARMNTGAKETTGPFAAAIRSSLSKVSHVTLTADITGTPEDYKVSISSDLDRVLKDSVGKLVQEQSARLEKELKAAVLEKTDKQLKDLKDSFGGLNSMGGKLDDAQNELSALLKDATQTGGAGTLRLRR
jgi:uncharacterized protein (TIGR03545 family)